jgi:L-rhamnonate dehydratase
VKVIEISTVEVDLPRPEPRTPARRANWNDYAPRGLPANKYDAFPPGLPIDTPGFSGKPVWVKVTAEDGSWGLGRCSFGRPVAALIEDHLGPLVVGRDCFATEMLNDLMWQSSRRHGTLGLSAVAQSGIDLALWDLKGKLLGQPVYRLIGGPSRERITCYCTSDDLDWSLELGFEAFKITNPVHYRQGRAGLDILEQKVAAAREQVGRAAELMLNPVMAFDVEFTVRVAERLRPYELRWIEEPLIPEDIEGYAAIKRAVPWQTIATGEDHHTRIPFRQLVERRCVDIVQPDLQWCGGLTEALKIYAIAEAAGIRTIPHGTLNTPYGQHFAFAMPDCEPAEFHLSSPVGVPLAEVVPIPGMAVPHDGHLVPSDAPGFGIEIPEHALVPWQPHKDVQAGEAGFW